MVLVQHCKETDHSSPEILPCVLQELVERLANLIIVFHCSVPMLLMGPEDP